MQYTTLDSEQAIQIKKNKTKKNIQHPSKEENF